MTKPTASPLIGWNGINGFVHWHCDSLGERLNQRLIQSKKERIVTMVFGRAINAKTMSNIVKSCFEDIESSLPSSFIFFEWFISWNIAQITKAINPIIGKMIAPKRKTIAPTSSDTDERYSHEHIMMILLWCYHVRIRGSLWLDGSSNRSVWQDPLLALWFTNTCAMGIRIFPLNLSWNY